MTLNCTGTVQTVHRIIILLLIHYSPVIICNDGSCKDIDGIVSMPSQWRHSRAIQDLVWSIAIECSTTVLKAMPVRLHIKTNVITTSRHEPHDHAYYTLIPQLCSLTLPSSLPPSQQCDRDLAFGLSCYLCHFPVWQLHHIQSLYSSQHHVHTHTIWSGLLIIAMVILHLLYMGWLLFIWLAVG